MPFTLNTSPHRKFRLLISGLSQSGKTTSLPTFIYGPYLYTDLDQQGDAMSYALEQGKHMVIISCPGETGHRSLLVNTAHVTSYYDESEQGEKESSAGFSAHIMEEFKQLLITVVKNKPDILALDGIPGLWYHWMNDVTNGDYFAGIDLALNPDTQRPVQFRSASFHSRTHNVFRDFIDKIYKCSVPLVICTTREDWEAGTKEGDGPGRVDAVRYLWPNIPGKMGKEVPGWFDARVSARLESRCLHSGCPDSKGAIDHYIWQFCPRGDVQGVGIKGLKVTNDMKRCPYIHQNGQVLLSFIEQFS